MCVVNESLASVVATHLLIQNLNTHHSLSVQNYSNWGRVLKFRIESANSKLDLILEACIDYEGFKCVIFLF